MTGFRLPAEVVEAGRRVSLLRDEEVEAVLSAALPVLAEQIARELYNKPLPSFSEPFKKKWPGDRHVSQGTRFLRWHELTNERRAELVALVRAAAAPTEENTDG